MVKRGKHYQEALSSIEPDKTYSPEEALQLAKDSARAKFDDNWSGRITGRRSLLENNNGGAINAGFNLLYEDECFILDSSFTRSYVHQTDVNATDTLFFKLTFKTLGDVAI